ncbi:MAG: site-specific integrase, partial [Gammaproteobacteria bacterium]
MGRKKIPGLVWRSGVWHIDKRIGGRRVCGSTGTTRLEEAEQVLARLIEEHRQAALYGIRPSRTFEQAAAKFVLENQFKRSLEDDVGWLKSLLPWIGQQPLERLH